ncbi:hypothetical protein CW357_07060 [Rummeliibacillus sp. TYF005]|uniref:GmrSD restriction endonuclease domain-containing protein n=1 Tax=unclassified Rummeliibacillus TaxID=2622809 RepID=UPI000E6708FF|nr:MULTISPECIES: DUF262 domain-containing protein [unclassified Rummeliibacillus]RIJ62821.1 hypothetical protein D1606_18170 [Rummeliibacillus sp. POC4]RPJ96101.1 hypothetical protein CW357_07060 [Rummeliibacillus sp. TYF005]
MLIDSIIKSYPLPLFLFSKNVATNKYKGLEILEGVQRLTVIFDFIENRILWNKEKFDLSVFPAANENLNKVFEIDPEIELHKNLDARTSSEFLNYQLAKYNI